MGLVDNVKAMTRSLTERTMPERVVFHHVPKCGGTSVGRALRKRYILSQVTVKPEESFRAFELFTGRSDREQMLVDVLDLREQMMMYHLFEDIRCVSLHVRFSAKAHAHFSDRYKFITILRDPVDRFLSHYFRSHGKANAHAAITASIKNLSQFAVVGRLDNLSGFADDVKRELGAKIKVGHENTMRRPRSKRAEVLNDKTMARVQELCAPDVAVWENAFG